MARFIRLQEGSAHLLHISEDRHREEEQVEKTDEEAGHGDTPILERVAEGWVVSGTIEGCRRVEGGTEGGPIKVDALARVLAVDAKTSTGAARRGRLAGDLAEHT